MGSLGAVSSATNSDSFNSGAFTAGQWNASNASAVSTGAHDNTYFAQLDDAGSGAYLNWTNSIIEQNHRYWTFRGWFKVVSRNSGLTVGLMDLKNVPGVNNADFFTDGSTGKCVVDLLNGDSAMTSFACDDNIWHLVEMKVDYGSSTYTLDWKIDGTAQTSISSTGQTTTTVKSLWLGDPTTARPMSSSGMTCASTSRTRRWATSEVRPRTASGLESDGAARSETRSWPLCRSGMAEPVPVRWAAARRAWRERYRAHCVPTTVDTGGHRTVASVAQVRD